MDTNNIKKHRVTPLLEVREYMDSGYKSLFAIQDIPPETILSPVTYQEILSVPSRYSLQLREGQHIELEPIYLRYTNHSCSPNVFFDTTDMVLQSIAEIKIGEEITFFYPSNEWKMIEPFACVCGSENCLGQIQGAAFLSDEMLNKYRLSAFVRERRFR